MYTLFIYLAHQLSEIETESKILVKKAVQELSYKRFTDILDRYDPQNTLLEEKDKRKTASSKKNTPKIKKEEKTPKTPFPTFGNRSFTDKIVDKLIGDNPHDRYALICSKCHTHNGLMPPNCSFPF
ncbi:hypothetical protein HZS_576, partial [Henneguya salminicola]